MSVISTTQAFLDEVNASDGDTIEAALNEIGTSEPEIREATQVQDDAGRSISLVGDGADLAFAFGVIVGSRLNS
jgi:hypothetical protein